MAPIGFACASSLIISFAYDKIAYDLRILTRRAMASPQPNLGFVLHDVARLLRKRFEQRVRGLGLTRSQWQVLFLLAQHEGINQVGLAEILEIEPITLLRILDRLEAAGLVERRTHAADRRVRLLYLTPNTGRRKS